MPDLTLNNLSNRLLSALEKRARDNERSIEMEIVLILQAAASESEVASERLEMNKRRRQTLDELVRESERLGFYDPPQSMP
jgi:plasmid stability protein